MTTTELINDIPLGLAVSAFNGVSMTPEKRGESSRVDYAETVANDWQNMLKHANTPDKMETLKIEFARYREGYAKRFRAYLHSSSRCVSSFIAGPSNFPARRMNKRADVAHKRLNEFLDYRKRALGAIVKTLHPELRPIMSGDSDATERLTAKIQQAEKLQQVMRDCNAALRKNAKAGDAAQVAAIAAVLTTAGMVKHDPEIWARELLKPDFCGRVGFADYELQNNSANIRRMKQRLESISRNQAAPEVSQDGTMARFEDCPAENRVRLFFPGKPSEEIRTRLKRAGFRWSPTIGAWQAYRNSNSIETAKKEAGQLLTVEKPDMPT